MLHLRQRADAKTRCVTVDGMPRVITEIKDLKAEIDAVSQIAASGDAGWATQLGCFSFAPNVDHLQAMDPRSQATSPAASAIKCSRGLLCKALVWDSDPGGCLSRRGRRQPARGLDDATGHG